MRTISVLLLSLLGCAGAIRWDELTPEYGIRQFQREFGISYASQAETDRRGALLAGRVAAAVRHNADPSQSWKRGINKFSDRTESELARGRGLDRAMLYHSKETGPVMAALANTSLPDRLDWREHRPAVVTPVKNQGGCGSCWAFASTETLESHWALHTGQLQDLAPQFILDCTPNPDKCGGQGGCQGGTAKLAYERLKALTGIPSEWEYPYVSGTGNPGGKCRGLPLGQEHPHSGAIMRAANVTGHVSVTSNSYSAVMQALQLGPLTITVDAGAWHDYESGVFAGGNHTNPSLDHLVQLVGYGTEGGKDYWLVRNSWTPGWGEAGYIKLLRSASPSCGVDLDPADGDGCAGGPATVKVCGQSGILYDAAYPTVN